MTTLITAAKETTIRVAVIETLCHLTEIAQLGERQTEGLRVPGSNMEGSNEL